MNANLIEADFIYITRNQVRIVAVCYTVTYG